jgi:hypothetical protein
MRITYLFGAGASAQALPTVTGIPQALENFINLIENDFEGSEEVFVSSLDIKRNKAKIQILTDLDWLKQASLNHSSIDTFAKKLYLTGKTRDLKRLKSTLDLYFTIEQLFKGIDFRYDLFYSTILRKKDNGDIELPTNVNCLTWNYDIQLELAATGFFQIQSPTEIEKKLNIVPFVNSRGIYQYDFAIVKLNGTASGRIRGDKFDRINIDISQFGQRLTKNDKKEILDNCMREYVRSIEFDNNIPSLMFAWEEEPLSAATREFAKSMVRLTEILVVIGYSFPNFNRDIDKMLFTSMPNLKKVIVQSASTKSVDAICQKIKALYPNSYTIESYVETDDFFIPFEF